MSRSWIGSIISADCGDSLGTYQGQVKSVDDGAQTLTLAGPFRNGLKCEVKELTLCAGDIRYLKILMSPYDASNVLSKRATPSKLTKEITEEAVVIGCVSPRSVVSQGQGDRHHSNHHTQNGRSPVTLLSSGGYMVSPVKHRPDNNNSPHYGYTNGLTNGNHANRNHRYTPPNDEACNYRPRRNSTSDVKKKSTTPRKIDFKQRPTPREDCFSAPTDSYLDEFDFEKNLALFDKKAVFEEIENSSHPMVICANKDKRTAKYRCDENVLQSGPVVLQQIKVPSSETKSYVTDSGLLVPCITPEMRAKLMVAADGVGLNESRLIEMLGRSASEMVLQLLGGSHRMSPQNNHQRPVVVVLCGDHKQGAQGVNSARHLANHNVQTEVFVPSRQPRHKVLEQELNLYQLTGSKVTSDIKDLPVGTVDMVISAVDCHDAASGLLDEDWYQSLVKWVPLKRAPVLSVDPPTRGTPFQSKWSLGVGLPLALPSSCGQVYLSDLSLPKKVFSDIGIKYLSPFGHKFVIPLHAKS